MSCDRSSRFHGNSVSTSLGDSKSLLRQQIPFKMPTPTIPAIARPSNSRTYKSMIRLLLALLIGLSAISPSAAQSRLADWLPELPLFGKDNSQEVVDPFLVDYGAPNSAVVQTSAAENAGPHWSPQRSASDAVYVDQASPREPPPIQTASLPNRMVPPSDELLESLATEPQLPPGTRDGVFQKAFFTGTWAPPLTNEPDALGVGSLEAGLIFGFPMLRRDAPLLVTPQFGSTLLDNAANIDLPSTLYDASVDFTHLRKFGDGPWAMNAGVTVGYYSDFDQDSGDAVRVSGRGLAVYESAPGTKWVLGVAYLNRAGATVLPVAGLIHAPTDDVRWELTFPRPRVAWRTLGSVEADQRWFYVGGELGGGVWSVTRPSTGMLDVVNYRDYRALVGYERKIIGGLSRRFEVGYVFGREVEYESATPDVDLDDTLFVRTGLTY